MKDNNSKEIQENEAKTEVTRSSDTRYIVQRRKPSVFLSIILVLIGAIATAVIMLIFFGDKIISSNEENNTQIEEQAPENKEEEKKEEEKTEIKDPDLNIDGEFVKSLYEKIPIQYFCQSLYSYYKTTEADMTGNQKMLFILNNMRENNQYKKKSVEGIIDRLDRTLGVDGYINEVDVFNVEEVEDFFKSVFGSKQNIVKEDIETHLGYVYEYDKQDDCFYGHGYAGGGGFGFYQNHMIDSVEKSEDNKEIYIYEYYIKVAREYVRAQDSGITKVYTYSENSNYIGEIEESPESFYFDETKQKELFEKYKNNGLIKFKHTFRLDDNGNYYWYCCESLHDNQ